MVSARVSRASILAVGACVVFWSTNCQALELTSPDVTNGSALRAAQVNSRCGGQNLSPALTWSGAPNATQSYAITMFDSDANGGHGFWHWLVFDIPGSAKGLPAGSGSNAALPSGAVQGENDFGTPGYGGACPPSGSGTHHYTITVYALPAPQLPLGDNAGSPAIANYLKSHALATSALTGTYKR